MATSIDTAMTAAIEAAAHLLTGDRHDYDGLMELIGDAQCVLIGEASHGTHEFYRERARITQRLIVEKGFTAVAVEADWPTAYRINCAVRNPGGSAEHMAALSAFKRFPAWMWRNTDVLNFVGWLAQHNAGLAEGKPQVGFYGLDLYSLHDSVTAVLDYLRKIDPAAAQRARYRYSCFDHYGDDPQHYGYAATFNMEASCEDAVIAQLRELQQNADQYAQRDGEVAEDAFFYAEQNARLASNAEAYYRTMFQGHVASWNLRDSHMFETLNALIAHRSRHGEQTKVVIWAHNSHLGDARATEMSQRGELNLGQLVRERYGQQAVLIGFSTYRGTVTAADDWGDPAQCKEVRPALPESYEALLHAVRQPAFWLNLRTPSAAVDQLSVPRLERAIGVIYRPATERISHYFQARLAQQFDAILHFDTTQAVTPLGEWKEQ